MDLYLEQLPQQLVNGLTLGGVYALIAIGYTMVYGILGMLNFAHGDIYMVGSFLGLILLGLLSPFLGAGWAGILVAMVISMILVGLLGVFIQRVAYVPMLSAPRLSILITALAVSMVLYNSVMASTSGEYKAFPVDLGYDGIEFGNVFITYTQIILVSSTAILMTILHFFISRTMLGKAMRAIAIDQDACRLMGINVKSIIALTFFVGSALACAAGVMAGVYYGSIHFFMGIVFRYKCLISLQYILNGGNNVKKSPAGA